MSDEQPAMPRPYAPFWIGLSIGGSVFLIAFMAWTALVGFGSAPLGQQQASAPAASQTTGRAPAAAPAQPQTTGQAPAEQPTQQPAAPEQK